MTSIVGQIPDLALIHGWGLGSFAWQPLLEPLSKSWRVHLIDLPGYGESPSDGADFTATAQTLIDTLPKAVTLCGWSLGAMLAMRAALLAPDRVAALVLVGATASFVQRGDWCSAQPQELLNSFAANVERQPEQTLQRFVALLSQGDTLARPITRTLLASLRNGRTPDSAVLACGLGWLCEIDLRPRLRSITTRSLLIHGENDVVTPVAAAQYLSETIPDVRLEVFVGAGHAPFLSDPDRFVQLLNNFRHARTAT